MTRTAPVPAITAGFVSSVRSSASRRSSRAVTRLNAAGRNPTTTGPNTARPPGRRRGPRPEPAPPAQTAKPQTPRQQRQRRSRGPGPGRRAPGGRITETGITGPDGNETVTRAEHLAPKLPDHPGRAQRAPVLRRLSTNAQATWS